MDEVQAKAANHGSPLSQPIPGLSQSAFPIVIRTYVAFLPNPGAEVRQTGESCMKLRVWTSSLWNSAPASVASLVTNLAIRDITASADQSQSSCWFRSVTGISSTSSSTDRFREKNFEAQHILVYLYMLVIYGLGALSHEYPTVLLVCLAYDALTHSRLY